MPFTELLEWYDYWQLEPFGEEFLASRADMRNALLCKLIKDFQYWLAGEKSPHQVTDFALLPLEKEQRLKYESPKEVEVTPTESGEKKGATISSELVTQLFIASARS